jgi:hypothetical protein
MKRRVNLEAQLGVEKTDGLISMVLGVIISAVLFAAC